MKKLLFILICLPLFFSSCTNDSQKNKSQVTISDAIVSFNVTSKNPDLTSKSGKEVSLNEMKTIQVKSGDKILFKTYNFTLDKEIAGALNFYSNDGILMCNAPTKLFVMSMPPDGHGLTMYNAGDNFEISGMTLIKANEINFVISDIISK